MHSRSVKIKPGSTKEGIINPLPDLMRWLKEQETHSVYLSELYKRCLLFSLSRFISACLFEKMIQRFSFVKIKRHISSLEETDRKELLKLSGNSGSILLLTNKPADLLNLHVLDFPTYKSNKGIVEINNHNQFFDVLKNLRIMRSRDINKSRTLFENSLSNLLLAVWKNCYSGIRINDGHLPYRNDVSYYEALCTSGHMLYPFPKFRSRFTFNDSFLYSNEQRELIELPLFAIPKCNTMFSSYSYRSSDDFYRVLFNNTSISNYLEEILPDNNILPIHPWQIRNVKFVKRLIHSNGGFPLKDTIKAKSLVSIRTLYCPDSNIDVKLSLSTAITSVNRNMYQVLAQNAPIISNILSVISKSKVIPTLKFQEDIASIRYRDFAKGPFLTAIFRVHLSFMEFSRVLPATYLYDEMLQLNGETPILNIIKSFIKEHSSSSLEFFSQYCRILLEGPLTLLLRFGIGLEPHLQNCLVAFKGSVPVMLILKDSDTANLVHSKLEHFINMSEYSWYPYTWELMQAERFSVSRFWHAAIRSHIGILIYIISKNFKEDEKCLWHLTKDIIDDIVGTVKSNSDVSMWSQIEKSASYFFKRYEDVKCLLRMRIMDHETFLPMKRLSPLRSCV